MTDERAMEILDPDHLEYYKSIEPIIEACRIGVKAIKRVKELEAENAELCEKLKRAIELPPGDRVWYIAEDEEGQESYIISKPTSSLTVEELKYEMDKKYFTTREAAENDLRN